MYENRKNSTFTTVRETNFQKYFEGYSTVRSVTPDGRLKVDMVYTAPYWVQEVSDREWIRRKLCYAGLTVITLGLYLLAALMPLGGEYVKFVMLPGGITAALLLFQVTYLLSYIFCPRKLTIYDYHRTHSALCRWPFITAIGMSVTAIMSVVYLLFGEDLLIVQALACTGCYLVAAAAAIAIYKIESKTKYYEEENENGFFGLPS